MPSLKNADVINVDFMSAMHITNIDVMSEKTDVMSEKH